MRHRPEHTYNTALVVTHADAELALVSIKGSTNLDDWWHNMDFKTADDGDVTRGFDAKAKALKDKILECLQEKKKVLICGHSLGGAVATLITHALNKERPDVKTVTVTIGAPRCGKAKFMSAYDGSQVPGTHATLRLMNYQDLVPTVPPLSMGYQHVGTGIVLRRATRHGGLASASDALGIDDHTYSSYFKNEVSPMVPKLLLNRHARSAYYENIRGRVKVGSRAYQPAAANVTATVPAQNRMSESGCPCIGPCEYYRVYRDCFCNIKEACAGMAEKRDSASITRALWTNTPSSRCADDNSCKDRTDRLTKLHRMREVVETANKLTRDTLNFDIERHLSYWIKRYILEHQDSTNTLAMFKGLVLLRVGARVEIHGLVKEKEKFLNGKKGKIVKLMNNYTTARVDIDIAEVPCKWVNLKEATDKEAGVNEEAYKEMAADMARKLATYVSGNFDKVRHKDVYEYLTTEDVGKLKILLQYIEDPQIKYCQPDQEMDPATMLPLTRPDLFSDGRGEKQ